MDKLFIAAIKDETFGIDYFKHIGVGKINATMKFPEIKCYGGLAREKRKKKYIITTTLRSGILDNAGKATTQALNTLGFSNVSDVRIGKTYELECEEKDIEKNLKEDKDKVIRETEKNIDDLKERIKEDNKKIKGDSEKINDALNDILGE